MIPNSIDGKSTQIGGTDATFVIKAKLNFGQTIIVKICVIFIIFSKEILIVISLQINAIVFVNVFNSRRFHILTKQNTGK